MADASIHSADHVADRRLAFALDASALLAYLMAEPGGGFVAEVLEHSVISAVNWAEVLQHHQRLGIDHRHLREDLSALGFGVVAFSVADSENAARLFGATRSRGLSLGDRACLALADSLSLTALTADRAWRDLDLDIRIDVIR